MEEVCISLVLGLCPETIFVLFTYHDSANKVGKSQLLKFSVDLTNATQVINGYVMCDEIGERELWCVRNRLLSCS